MKKKYLGLILISLSFVFIYTLATAIYFTDMYKTSKYYANLDFLYEGAFYLLNIPGILFSSLFMKNNYTKKRLFTAYSVSLFLIIFSSFLLFLPLTKVLHTIILLISFIPFGCTQGVYIFLIVLFVPKSNRCFIFGLSASLSVILNALISLIGSGEFCQSIYSVIVYFITSVIACCILYIALYKFPCEKNDSSLETESPTIMPAWTTKTFLVSCIFITLSWMIQSLGFFFPYNGVFILGVSNEILRITNIIGLIVAGYLLDRDKKLGSIISLILLATPMLYIFLQDSAGITLALYLLSYLFTGVLSVYRMGIIADLCEKSNSKGESVLWMCTFGLIFGRLGEAVGGTLGIKLSGNTVLLLTVTSFVLVIAVAFFIFHYFELFIPVPQVVQNYDDKLTSFKIKYDLSNREMDVLKILLDGHTNLEISDMLYVSENTVRFHVSNILKKTGCKNRKEISTLFYEV